MAKKKIILIVILTAFFTVPKDLNAQCDIDEVVLLVNKYILSVPKADKEKRKSLRQGIRSLCGGKTTAEGCSLKDVIKYAEKGQNASQIQEKCK